MAYRLSRCENHTCLTLLGSAQGIGKTWFLNHIGISKKLTYSGYINPLNNDHKTYYAEKTLIVLDELESTTKMDMAALKSNMTLSSITVRRPYARRSEILPRRASFCACANDIQVLGDLTGDRRWLCVEVEEIDYLKVTPELMQNVYSQALEALNAGVKGWFDVTDIRNLRKNNERFTQPYAEEEALLTLFEAVDFESPTATHLTNTELLNRLVLKNPGHKFSARRLGQALKKHGFHLRNIREGKNILHKYAVFERIL
jgi:predicted P-loop ATPase